MTTSRHISHVYRAIHNDARVFRLPLERDLRNVNAESIEKYARDTARELHSTALRSRKHIESNQSAYTEHCEQMNALAQFMGYRWRIECFGFSAEEKERAKQSAEKERARKERREKERARKLAKEHAESARKWINGETSYCQDRTSIYLRLSSDGSIVQTSYGAEIPSAHAKRIWPIIHRCKSTGTEYVRNGHTEHVGHFTIDRIGADGTLTAGCHVINYAELERFSAVLFAQS